jgi:8-oxo-dGTP pyrophosphatase MutT (NUDIX family)
VLIQGDELEPSVDPAVARLLIEAVAPGDPGLEADRLRILELLAIHGDIAVRTSRPGHLTGSAFVVDHERRRCVLLFHHKLQRWLQPGGHADGEMNLAAVAWREATEETGVEGLLIDPQPVDLDIHRVAPPAEDAHLHLDVRFVVVAPPTALLVRNHESDALRWVDREQLDDYELDDGLRRLAARSWAALGR